LQAGDVIAITASANREHVSGNRAAADLRLDAAIREALEAAFPPPRGPSSLSVL